MIRRYNAEDIQELFCTERLLKSMNIALITHIPKCQSATTIKDYRPIAWCNVLYEVISNILTTRMSQVMSCLVSGEQAARFIHENDILDQEIILGYGCMIGMGLQKAYDFISYLFWYNYNEGPGIPF